MWARSASTSWLWFDLPAPLPPRPLLQVTAGYDAPSTPVDLSVDLTTGDQKTGLAAGVDDHGAAAPKAVELLITPPDAGAQLFVDCSDDTGSHADVNNPFTIWADVITDPDVNDPSNPTPITLSGGARASRRGAARRGLHGRAVGDRAGWTPSRWPCLSSVTRPIPSLTITAPPMITLPPAYDMSYQVKDPTGTLVYADHVANQYISLDAADGGVSPLSAALLVTSGETYTVDVLGYEPSGTGTPAPGDVRSTHTPNVEVMPDLDTNEPNDTLDRATSVTFSGVGDEQTLTGRLGYIGDDDWYALEFPANSGPTRLHYKVTPLTSGGRYPPILGTALAPLPFPDRVSQTSFLVTAAEGGFGGVHLGHQRLPAGHAFPEPEPDGGPAARGAVCDDADESADGGALCLISARDETSATEESFPPLQNFSRGSSQFPTRGGADLLSRLQVPRRRVPHFIFDYQLDPTRETDPGRCEPDRRHRAAGVAAGRNGQLPNLPGGGVSGAITVGYGYLSQFDLTNIWYPGDDVRAPNDYDATPSSTNFYAFAYPASYTRAPNRGDLGAQLVGGQ